ncbi:MAG: SusC/RagA family TonB-linked outer membrane protein, partial [Gemmatimonadaceae bacterium]
TTAQINVAEKIADLPVQTMGHLLSGRAAGVQISSAGATGAGSRIRIRGQSSLSQGNDPLIYVDGVRVISNTATGGTSGPSRFDDFNPAEIESIEVIKGPSAATLYGTEAANGVISITTKRGKSGKTVWNVFTENGVITDPNKGSYPLQYYGWGSLKNVTTGVFTPNTTCRLTQIAAGLCLKQDSLTTNNVLNNPITTPLGAGHRNNYGLQLSGGTDKVQFFISGDAQDEVGVYRLPDNEIVRLKALRGVSELPDWLLRPNALSRVNLRANLSAQLSDKANIQVASGYVTSTQRLPQNEDNSTGLMVNAIAGLARTDNTQTQTINGVTYVIPLYGQFGGPMGDILSVQNRQDVQRFTNSVQGRWQALNWLSTRATAGLDLTEINSFGGNYLDEGPTGNGRVGSLSSTRTQIEQYTVDFGGTGTWNVTSGLQSKLSAGVQYARNISRNTNGTGNTLPPGATTISGGAIRTASQSTTESITLGTYIEEVVSVGDRLFLTGGIRLDDNSAFGASFSGAKYPKASVSYAMSDESWFPKSRILETLRLRSAYGASGQAPGSNSALRYYGPTSFTLPGGTIGTGVTLAALGNKELRPEFSAEYEGGFDLGGFNGATNFELTYYSKATKDALIDRDVAPSIIGLSQQTVNIGRTKTAGLEFVLNQRLLDRRMIAANLNITGSTTRNKLVTLGDGVSPIFTGNRTTQKNTTGYPLFGLWGRTYTINDRNGDGIVQAPTGVVGSATYDRGDITITDTSVFIAPTYPKLEMAISPSLELFDHKLRFNAQFDHKSGFKKLNNTLRHQCQGGGSCRGLYDPTASLELQAAAVAINSYGSLTGFYKDGAFTRFRELSAAYQLPDRLARMAHASRMNVIVTGRNLAVWTKYDGVDPEATVGNGDARGFEEYFSTPPLRTFTFRLNFTF